MHRICLSVCLILLIGSLGGTAPAGDKPPADPHTLASWIDKRVQAWQPTAAEKRFDEIGWVKDIRTALNLAQEHGRPVFLFTHDGRMGVGRC